MTKDSTYHSAFESSNQALLEALKKQAIRVPLIMTVVILILGGFTVNQKPVLSVVLWIVAAITMQVVRSSILLRLPSQVHRTSKSRLRIATVLSMINGLVLASAGFLFFDLDETARAAFSIIMTGLVAGTIATSHGYRPIFLSIVTPMLGSVIFVWAFSADAAISSIKAGSIIFLVIALGGVLYASSRDVYNSFLETFAASAKLEAALQAEQSANAAKTRFLAAASHDLRQPLHALSLLSATLTLRDLDQDSFDIAQRINLTLSDLSSELNVLLDISKFDASVVPMTPHEFDVNTSISRLLAEIEPIAAAKHIELEYQHASDHLLYTDRLLFERLVRNLLDNAIKYTDSGSIKITVQKSTAKWTITIQDTGIGIAQNEQEKIWEEFYQLSNFERDRQKGLGLGLSIVSRLSALLGGSISMESTPEEGSKFTIELPEISPHQRQNCITPAEQQLLPLSDLKNIQGTKVLVVDDDKAVRSVTRLLLENCGCVVFEADGTREAVESLNSEAPDIVLCDLRLPDSDDGFKTIELLKIQQPDIPIIIISGDSSAEQLKQANDLQLDFIAKPVNVLQLLNRISYKLQNHTN